MSKLPTITSILAIPGLVSNPAPEAGSVLLVGVVVDGKYTGWGECRPAGANRPEDPWSRFHVAEALETIRNLVEPALRSQPLAHLHELLAKVEGLTETKTVTRAQPQEEPVVQPRTLSRRDLFAGRFWSEESPDGGRLATESIRVERPIHPAVRCGISQALLEALAHARGRSLAEILAQEYDLLGSERAIAIHAELRDQTLPAHWEQAASLGYSLDEGHPESELDEEGRQLQRFTRRLSSHISESDANQIIHLNVRGRLGYIHHNNIGRILGAVFGLQQAAAPHPLRVQDPLILEDRAAQIEAMTQLRDYMRLRKMPSQLVAGAWIDSLEDVEAFLQANSAHALFLEMSRLGSIDVAVAAVNACREHGAAPLLSGWPAGFVTQVALAIQPDWVALSPVHHGDAAIAPLYNEMAQTLAGLAAAS